MFVCVRCWAESVCVCCVLCGMLVVGVGNMRICVQRRREARFCLSGSHQHDEQDDDDDDGDNVDGHHAKLKH